MDLRHAELPVVSGVDDVRSAEDVELRRSPLGRARFVPGAVSRRQNDRGPDHGSGAKVALHAVVEEDDLRMPAVDRAADDRRRALRHARVGEIDVSALGPARGGSEDGGENGGGSDGLCHGGSALSTDCAPARAGGPRRRSCSHAELRTHGAPRRRTGARMGRQLSDSPRQDDSLREASRGPRSRPPAAQVLPKKDGHHRLGGSS